MKLIFRIISFLEGVSYLLLLFIATPIKYIHGNTEYVKLLGMPHGILFVLYILVAILMKQKSNWNLKTFGIILVGSIVPFGTFYVDKNFLR